MLTNHSMTITLPPVSRTSLKNPTFRCDLRLERRKKANKYSMPKMTVWWRNGSGRSGLVSRHINGREL